MQRYMSVRQCIAKHFLMLEVRICIFLWVENKPSETSDKAEAYVVIVSANSRDLPYIYPTNFVSIMHIYTH